MPWHIPANGEGMCKTPVFTKYYSVMYWHVTVYEFSAKFIPVDL